MRMMFFPKNQLFQYDFTGKFKALDDQWQHDAFPLTNYELIVMTEGTLYMTYMNEKYTVNPGEYLLLPPSNGLRGGFKRAYSSFYWLHFSFKNAGETSYQSISSVESSTAPRSCLNSSGIPSGSNVQFTNSDIYMQTRIHSLIRQMDTPDRFSIPQQAKLPLASRTVVKMKQLQDLVKNNYPAISLNAACTDIIAELYGQLSAHVFSSKNVGDRKQVYLDIVDYIQKNLHKNIRISEIADQFDYNSKYLSHMFAELSGIPLKQFILNQKIYAANMMLTDGDKQISVIAENLGFSDVHNFSKTYKKITGLTPTEYRSAYAKRCLYHV